MTFKKAFTDLQKLILKADASGLEGKFAFQCVIEGDGEGTFYIAFENNTLSVEPYDYADNTATFKASAETYKNILTGKKTVDEALAAFELVVDGDDGCANILTYFADNASKKATKKAAAKTDVKKETAKKPAAKKAEIKAEPVKEEVKKEAPKAETKKEAPKAEAKKEAPKAEVKKGAPKAEAKKETSKKPAAKKTTKK